MEKKKKDKTRSSLSKAQQVNYQREFKRANRAASRED